MDERGVGWGAVAPGKNEWVETSVVSGFEIGGGVSDVGDVVRGEIPTFHDL